VDYQADRSAAAATIVGFTGSGSHKRQGVPWNTSYTRGDQTESPAIRFADPQNIDARPEDSN